MDPHPASPPPASRRLPRLIATDLDGTLLRPGGTVSPRTVAALAAAEAAGVQVIFVTARPVRWMEIVREHVHGHGIAICANGAAVVDLHRDEIVETRPLLREQALLIARALRGAAPGVTFGVERTTDFHHEPGWPSLDFEPISVVAPIEKLIAPGPGVPDLPILKLLAHHDAQDPDAFLALGDEVAGEHGTFTRSSPTALLEISAPGVTKARTLAARCLRFGIRPDEVVAFCLLYLSPSPRAHATGRNLVCRLNINSPSFPASALLCLTPSIYYFLPYVACAYCSSYHTASPAASPSSPLGRQRQICKRAGARPPCARRPRR
nr:HAD-IIB family hydrolase [Streptomyces specialis]